MLRFHEILVGLVLTAGLSVVFAPDAACADDLQTDATREAMEEWQSQRFGLFVHWGPVSLKGTEIGWSRRGPRRGRARPGTGTIPMEEYDNLYKKFNPVRFDADEWCRIAKDAGMRYIVFTSKHHDGFSMFDAAAMSRSRNATDPSSCTSRRPLATRSRP